ncbi:hypothetical protein J4E91_008950 [Alternaria rosae]|nr:hypothetical protein J4E91_008950 [Alternaria rosae]
MYFWTSEIYTLATIKRIKNSRFKEFEIPTSATKQSVFIHAEFAKYLPFNEVRDTFKLETWLCGLMRLKLELLVSHDHHRIDYVRPGTTFDPERMTVVSDEHGGVRLASNARYRVCLCVIPALVSGIDDTAWPQGPTSSGEAQYYKLALLEARDPFADVSDQWKALLYGVLVSKAVILVEAIPKDMGMVVETQ